MRKSNKSANRSPKRKTKKERKRKKAEETRKRKAEKLERKVQKSIKQYANKNLTHIRRYEATKDLPQYKNLDDRINNARTFLRDDAQYRSQRRLDWIAHMVSKEWSREKAEGLYDLVTTDIYNQFRQKYKPPSDYYDILLEDFEASDIEKAMLELNQSNDYGQGDYKSSEIINALYDILVDKYL